MKIAIISLTYNRKEYIEKSFASLRKKAGLKFDHYIFDDNSNAETQKFLKSQKQHFTKLVFRSKNLNIAQNFVDAVHSIPDKYDYYVKLDSDIEILSDKILTQMVEVAQYPDYGCVSPRIEGVPSSWSPLNSPLEFFNGHAIRFVKGIPWGGFMFFTREVRYYQDSNLLKVQADGYGADSSLLDTIQQINKRIIFVEDLSVYHIDNSFGQRKAYWEYYRDRNRWTRLDKAYTDFLRATSEIGPLFFNRQYLDILYKSAEGDYSKFKKLLIKYTKEPNIFQNANIPTKVVEPVEKKVTMMKTVYKIISPTNFPSDPHLEHGSTVIYDEIPEWAKNNPNFVIEKVEVKETLNKKEVIKPIILPTTRKKIKKLKKTEPGKDKKSKKPIEIKCEICNQLCKGSKGLKSHIRLKHKRSRKK